MTESDSGTSPISTSVQKCTPCEPVFMLPGPSVLQGKKMSTECHMLPVKGCLLDSTLNTERKRAQDSLSPHSGLELLTQHMTAMSDLDFFINADADLSLAVTTILLVL